MYLALSCSCCRTLLTSTSPRRYRSFMTCSTITSTIWCVEKGCRGCIMGAGRPVARPPCLLTSFLPQLQHVWATRRDRSYLLYLALHFTVHGARAPDVACKRHCQSLTAHLLGQVFSCFTTRFSLCFARCGKEKRSWVGCEWFARLLAACITCSV